MTKEECERLGNFIKDWTAAKVAEGPEACRRHLIGLGIYDEAGNLTPQYGGN